MALKNNNGSSRITRLQEKISFAENLLKATDAENLIENYRQNNSELLKTATGKTTEEARFFVWEIDVLIDFLTALKLGMEANGIKEKGVQFALGQYPATDSTGKIKAENLNQQTLVIRPIDLLAYCSGNAENPQGNQPLNRLAPLGALNYGHIRPPY